MGFTIRPPIPRKSVKPLQGLPYRGTKPRVRFATLGFGVERRCRSWPQTWCARCPNYRNGLPASSATGKMPVNRQDAGVTMGLPASSDRINGGRLLACYRKTGMPDPGIAHVLKSAQTWRFEALPGSGGRAIASSSSLSKASSACASSTCLPSAVVT